jgi:predicted nucleic acid-binding protein
VSDIVLDASAVIELLLDSRDLLEEVKAAVKGHHIHAPALIDAEVLSAIAQKERAGDITAQQGTDAIHAWGHVSVERHGGHHLLVEAWRTRHSVRTSDGFYLALARTLGVPLITTDARLARAPHPGVEVRLIGDGD